MAYSIAFSGKGGTGKTTLAGFLVRYLVEKGLGPVLAVDADANANLNDVLGVTVAGTLGQAREEMKRGVGSGMTKDVFMEMKLQEAVVESKGFDLVVMGRPEGPGCYCAANSLLTQYLDKLIDNYPYIVIDNEAGMEHLSRLTTNNVNVLFAVSDPSRRSIEAASRIFDLTKELSLRIGRMGLIVNQVAPSGSDAVKRSVERFGMELLGTVPLDPRIEEMDLEGRPTFVIDRESVALNAAFEIFERTLGA